MPHAERQRTGGPWRNRPWARLLLCTGLSALLHLAAVALLGGLAPQLGLPSVDVVWLDLDNALLAAPEPYVPAALEPPQDKASTAATKSAETTKAPPGAKPTEVPAKPPPRYKAEHVQLGELAPKQAALILLMRCDRIRRSPYADAVRELLAVFYDSRILLEESGIDPLSHFDALLIATPNPYRVTRTFLAARSRLPTRRIRRHLDRRARSVGGEIAWSRRSRRWSGRLSSPPRLAHDPRRLYLDGSLLMLADPRLGPELFRIARSSRSGVAKDEQGKPSLIASLRGIADVGGSRRDDPALLLQAVNLPRLVRLPSGLPSPESVRITAPATRRPRVAGVLTFASRRAAAIFHRSVRARIEQALQSVMLRFLGFGSLLERLRLARHDKRIDARLDLSSAEMVQLLAFFRGLIPQVVLPGAPRSSPISRPLP